MSETIRQDPNGWRATNEWRPGAPGLYEVIIDGKRAVAWFNGHEWRVVDNVAPAGESVPHISTSVASPTHYRQPTEAPRGELDAMVTPTKNDLPAPLVADDEVLSDTEPLRPPLRIETPPPTIVPPPEPLPWNERLNALTLQKNPDGDFVLTGPNTYLVLPVSEMMTGDKLIEELTKVVAQLKAEPTDEHVDFTPIPARLENQAAMIKRYQEQRERGEVPIRKTASPEIEVPEIESRRAVVSEAEEGGYLEVFVRVDRFKEGEEVDVVVAPAGTTFIQSNPMKITFGTGSIGIGTFAHNEMGEAGIFFRELKEPQPIGELGKDSPLRRLKDGFLYFVFENDESAATVVQAIESARAKFRFPRSDIALRALPAYDADALRRFVNEKIGTASMCWTELPSGVFETEKAMAIARSICDEFLAAHVEMRSDLNTARAEVARLEAIYADYQREREEIMEEVEQAETDQERIINAVLGLPYRIALLRENLAKARVCEEHERGKRVEAVVEIESAHKFLDARGAIARNTKVEHRGERTTIRLPLETRMLSMIEFNVKTRTARLEGELNRWKEGRLSEEEFQNLCHNLPKSLTAEAFCQGCEAYQEKLFGFSPSKRERERLEAEMSDLRTGLKSWETRIKTWAAQLNCEPDDNAVEEAILAMIRQNLNCDAQFAEMYKGLEIAWAVIANAGGGNWETQGAEWTKAAENFRDNYFHKLPNRSDALQRYVQPAIDFARRSWFWTMSKEIALGAEEVLTHFGAELPKRRES